jgi:hypothetical protein
VHHDPSFWHQLWDNAFAGIAVVALVFGAWVSARSLGLLARPKHWLRCTYLPPHDLVGFFAMPYFMLEYENRGNVPIVFSDFMLMLPRADDCTDSSGNFTFHPGAELFIDGEPKTTVAGYQFLQKLDHRTCKVRLEPGEMHTDYFDLGVFFPGVTGAVSPWDDVRIPPDFRPILSFHDNFGNTYHCDDTGIHSGQWTHPSAEALRAAGGAFGLGDGIESRWKRIRWFGWKQRRTAGLGESPDAPG